MNSPIHITLSAGKQVTKKASLFNWTTGLNRLQDAIRSTHLLPRGENPLKSKASIVLPGSSSSAFKQVSGISIRKPQSEKLILFLGSAFVGFSFWFYNHFTHEVFFTKRSRLMLIDWETEKEWFHSTKEENNKKEDSVGPLVDDVFAQEVFQIASTIIKSCESDFIDVRGKLDWNIGLHLNPEVNAFNSPGGYLTVYTGLIDLVCQAELDGDLEDARNGLALVFYPCPETLRTDFSSDTVVCWRMKYPMDTADMG